MKTEISKSVSLGKSVLSRNDLVAFPTETVYGLGANALSNEAILKIYEAKSRPPDNPLIVHVSGVEMLKELLYPDPIPAIYDEAIAKYWPGPLTILVKKPACIPSIVTAGQDTVGIRMPMHPVALELIKMCGFPLAAPSANVSGRPSPTRASHVYHDLNTKIPLIIDGGNCESGVESTVLDCLRPIPAILRPGGVTAEQLREIYPNLVVYRKDFVDSNLENAPTTPGMKYQHYTPNAKVVLVEYRGDLQQQSIIMKREYEKLVKDGIKVGVLSVTSGDYPIEIHIGNTDAEIARNIFAGLRQMEEFEVGAIIVQGIDDCHQGMAVMNRLRKAASTICSE